MSMWTSDFHEAEASYPTAHAEMGANPLLDAWSPAADHAAPEHDEPAQDITQRYFDDIGRLRVLSADEEKTYARRLQSGDQAAREILITHNLKLVVYIAKRYLRRGLPLLDLVEEGNLGLMHALDKFDPDRGFRLSTYAHWWIRQSIERALMNYSRTIRLPVHVAKELNVCLRARHKLESEGVMDPSPEEIAHRAGKPVIDVRELLLLNRPPVPLDAPLDIDPDLTLGEAIADEHYVPADERLHQSELGQLVAEWLAKLSDKHREVVIRRFGLNNHDPATLEDLAQELQVSRERVRQIQMEAQKSLTAELKAKGMEKEDWLS